MHVHTSLFSGYKTTFTVTCVSRHNFIISDAPINSVHAHLFNMHSIKCRLWQKTSMLWWLETFLNRNDYKVYNFQLPSSITLSRILYAVNLFFLPASISSALLSSTLYRIKSYSMDCSLTRHYESSIFPRIDSLVAQASP